MWTMASLALETETSVRQGLQSRCFTTKSGWTADWPGLTSLLCRRVQLPVHSLGILLRYWLSGKLIVPSFV